jgi:hypothetical protein
MSAGKPEVGHVSRAAPLAIGRERLAELDQRYLAEALTKPADGTVAAPLAFGADQPHARDAAASGLGQGQGWFFADGAHVGDGSGLRLPVPRRAAEALIWPAGASRRSTRPWGRRNLAKERLQGAAVARGFSTTNVRRAYILAAVFVSWPATAEVKYSELAGHSIDVEWTDSRTYREANGTEWAKARTIRKMVYLGARNHIFDRTSVEQAKGAGPKGVMRTRGAIRADTQKSEGVGGLGEKVSNMQWSYEGGSLVQMLKLPEGAVRLTIDITADGNGFSCTLGVKELRKEGAGRIIENAGDAREVVSRTVSVNYCKVVDGNPISDQESK